MVYKQNLSANAGKSRGCGVIRGRNGCVSPWAQVAPFRGSTYPFGVRKISYCQRCGADVDDVLQGCLECGFTAEALCERCDSPVDVDGNCSSCGALALCIDCQMGYVAYLEACGICGTVRGERRRWGSSSDLFVPAPRAVPPRPVVITRIPDTDIGAGTAATTDPSSVSIPTPDTTSKEAVMPVTVPAITARMGSREYFITKMTAQEISGQVAVASELRDWHEVTLDQLYQRKLNQRRVEQDIAPYLAKTERRFFGAIIVWALNDEALVFEPVSDHVDVMAAYKSAAESMGFLVINGVRAGDRTGLVAIDGQHRLAALRNVVHGKATGDHADSVRGDEVTVIFIRDREVADARDLFTVLNRSARRVSKNDVLIMSEVDGAAVVARALTSRHVLAPNGLEHQPLVKWTSNTIALNDSEFTTLNAMYEMVSVVADHLDIDLQKGEESGDRPEPDDVLKVRVEAERWLEAFFAADSELEKMRHDVALIPKMRKEGRLSLLMKPVGVVAFFKAAGLLLEPEAGKMRDAATAIASLVKVSWDVKGTFWRGILTNAAGNVTNRREDIQLAADLAAWMVAGLTSHPKFQEAVLERYRRHTGKSSLPDPLV
jgi:DNA sulfur modification protein DndB